MNNSALFGNPISFLSFDYLAGIIGVSICIASGTFLGSRLYTEARRGITMLAVVNRDLNSSIDWKMRKVVDKALDGDVMSHIGDTYDHI